MIKIKNLNKYYNKGKQNGIHVINNVNITLPDTGLVCILGESGSGKTTLMNVIGGLDDFKGGTIEAFDTLITKNCNKKSDKLRNENYGYIFQNYYLLSEHTVYYNIMLALDMYDISDEEKEERINTVLAAVGMIKYKKRLISQLSGGQQQRVAIARALAKSPRVIFADEPTGNLDEANTMRIMSILKKISKQCLIVLVTHEKRLANFFADEIIDICDGKVVNHRVINSSNSSYSLVDDNNIYLQEYNQIHKENDISKINYYYDTEKSKIELNIIYENGKFYINSPQNVSITFLTNDNEKKVIDDKKPQIELVDVNNIDYSLSKIEQTKTPRLSIKETIKLAKSNIKMIGKKQVFVILSLLIMSVLLAVTVQDIMTLYFIDVQSVVKTDSHYVTVTAKKGSSIDSISYTESYKNFYENVVEGKLNENDIILINAKDDIKYEYSGYLQIEDVKANLRNYTCCPIEVFNENDLIYGRMPEAVNEIIIDKWVLENFFEQNKIIAATMPDIRFMLNNELKISKKDYGLKIVGICDSKEPNIYIDKYAYFGVVGWGNQIASLSSLKKAYPGSFDNIVLNDDEVLLNEKRSTSGSKTIKSNTFKEYNIVGYFDYEFPAQFVIDDSDYDEFLKDMILYGKEFKVYTNDKSSVINYFNSIPDDLTKNIQISVVDNYAEDIAYYRNTRSAKVNARLIVTITIFIISMVILYFTMKSNALKNIHNIAVYRLLGISKFNIKFIFVIENIIITTYTSLIGVLVTTGIMKFLASIPSLNITIIYPWYAIVGTILCLYVINTIIGIIPISSILSMPPAQITAKHDM